LPRTPAGQDRPVIRIGLVGAGFIAGRHVDSLAAEDRAFADAVRGMGGDVRAPYGEALRTHRLATAVAAAAGGGGTIHLATGPRR
jgi:predicted dehydrogenase